MPPEMEPLHGFLPVLLAAEDRVVRAGSIRGLFRRLAGKGRVVRAGSIRSLLLRHGGSAELRI